MEIKKIGIAGSGIMGAGIAQLASTKGFEVVLYDIKDEFVEKGLATVKKALQRLVDKEKMTAEDMAAALARVSTATDVKAFADIDLLIEAIVENVEIKKDFFAKVDAVCKPEAILCSNTSSISITTLAAATKRPDRFCGMHFFNPAPIMKLVEVIRGYDSSDETIATVKGLAETLGKTAVEVKKDTPGFVVNRILFPHFLEAIRIYEEGIASKEDIDTAVKLGLNYPMGPFELMDFGGLDTLISVTEYFFDESKESRWNLPQSARSVIRSGRYGKKSGKGWYDYDK